MRSPRLIPIPLILAAALAGCSATQSTTTVPAHTTRAEQAIGDVVANLASDVSGNDPTKICSEILAKPLVSELNKHGGCGNDLATQVGTINVYTLTVTKYTVSGTHATARVSSTYSGKTRTMTLQFVKQPKGGWRISGIG